MKKIFFNAFSYNHGGWFICEAHDWPYKNKTDKPVFVIKPHPDDTLIALGWEYQFIPIGP